MYAIRSYYDPFFGEALFTAVGDGQQRGASGVSFLFCFFEYEGDYGGYYRISRSETVA